MLKAAARRKGARMAEKKNHVEKLLHWTKTVALYVF